jgi:multicomponent Na+:H+ antiporter subunit D
VINALNKTMLFLAAGLRGPLVGVTFVLGVLSVAGVPPAAGFLSKLALIHTGLSVHSPALVAVIVAGSVLSFVYMFQIYQHAFWRDVRAETPSPWPLQVLPALLGLLVLGAGVWPEPLLALSREAAATLLRGR